MVLGMTDSKLSKIIWCRFLASSGEGERLRRAAGLSLADVAAEIGVHPATLRRWETGAFTPNSAAALRWFDVLHQIAETAQASEEIPS